MKLTPKEEAYILFSQALCDLGANIDTNLEYHECRKAAKEIAKSSCRVVINFINESMQGWLDTDLISHWEQIINHINQITITPNDKAK